MFIWVNRNEGENYIVQIWKTNENDSNIMFVQYMLAWKRFLLLTSYANFYSHKPIILTLLVYSWYGLYITCINIDKMTWLHAYVIYKLIVFRTIIIIQYLQLIPYAHDTQLVIYM